MTRTAAGATRRLAAEASGCPIRRWMIDAARSSLQVSVTVGPFVTVRGRFAEMRGSVQVADDPGRSRVEVRVGTASLTSGSATMDALLRNAGVIDSVRNPVICFDSRVLRFDPHSGRWLLVGLLATHGGVLDVTLRMPEPMLATDGTLRVSARGQLTSRDAVRLLSHPGLDRLLGRTMGLDLTVVARAA